MAKSSLSWLETAERYLEQGDLPRAQELCKRALSKNENDAEAHRLLALIAWRAGKPDEAIALARRAADADEASAPCLCTLGQLLTAAGHHAQAILELQRAVERYPAVAQAHLHLGAAYAAGRSPAAAEDAYRAALGLWPQYPEAHLGLGRLLAREGRADEAIASLEVAARLQEGNPDAWASLAEARAARGDTEGALAAYRSGTDGAPSSVRAWHALGQACLALGRRDAAERAFRRGVELDPDHAGCLLGLASALEQVFRFEEAAQPLRRILARVPGHVDATKGLARVLLSTGQLPEALQLAQRTSAAAPGDADAHFCLGNVLLRMQRPRESLVSYRHALALAQQSPKARFALASPLLMLGELAAGWDAYEARLGMAGVPWKIANVRERLWDGSDIGRQRLLVHTEQGLGDTLQFIRYLPLLRSRSGLDARIELLCEREFARLLGTVEGYDALHAPEKPAGIPHDVQIPLLSLPHRFGTTLDTIPSNVPYIRLPPEAKMQLERPAGTKLAVAFAWAGRPTHSDDRMRSCAIANYATLFDIAGVHFYSIQVGPRAGDIEPYLARQNVSSMTAKLTDLAATLAVIDQADLVIAVDTSVVHLAGAYGKPVWTLLAHGGEWRWLLDREDSPWYPGMRLFRQRVAGDWDEVFARVRAELETLVI